MFRVCLFCVDGYMVFWDYKNVFFFVEYNLFVCESCFGVDMFYFVCGDWIGLVVDVFVVEVVDLLVIYVSGYM